MAGRPIWYELMTPDAGAVAPFYKAVIGWDIPAQGHPMPNGSEYSEIRRADGGHAGGVLKLTPQMAEHGVKPAWFPYFDVPDVDAFTLKAKEMGAAVFIAPMSMEGVGRMAMLGDPQGASFYLMDPTPPPGQPDAQSDVFKSKAPGHCWWNELETTDEPAASAFYVRLFGWDADKFMPMGERGNYRFVEHHGQQIGAINPAMEDYMRVGWMPYFGVADIDAAYAAAKANGGKIHYDIHPVPGGDFIFACDDPAGALVGFTGPKGA